MSSDNKWGQMLKAILEMPQKLVRYLTPATRIFSPNDDNYPATGVQPFEGEVKDKN